MAITIPDTAYKWNGIEIEQKLTTWQQLPLTAHKYVVIHNTPEVSHTNTSMAAQYTLAQYYNNLTDNVCVHYYVDDKEVWHALGDNTKGIHAGDNRNPNGGNYNGIAIEIIEDETNAKAEDTGAKLAASLLLKYGLGIEALKQHYDFNGKICPLVIRPHWSDFKAKVVKYMDEISKANAEESDKTEQTVIAGGSLYTVQCGAFTSRENAEAYAKVISAAGFPCFVRLRGDMDGDGDVDVEDARLVLRKAVKIDE